MNNQQLAFDKLSKLKVGALFMEMGTGKTKVALDLIASKQGKIDYILWICPFSIKQEIEQERLKWHPELDIDIVGCETISMSDYKTAEIHRKVRTHKTFIVVDESLKIKNLSAKRTRRILQLGSMAKYKLILNGTPLSKNVLDLYPQMQFLSPKILNMTFNEFKDKYCEYYVRGKLKNKVKKQYNIKHLVSLIEPYIFDCELDLKKQKHYHDLYYSIEDLQEYDNKKHEILHFGDDSDFDFFAVTTYLQHYYCSLNSKFKLLNSLIAKIEGQVIVFVKFLDSIPFDSKRLTGDMSTQERKNVLKSFKNGEFKTLFITYGCGSFGLNLQNCKNVIFADHTFDYAVRLQAEARIYRLGQKDDVDYYNLNCTCGLDNLIRGCLEKKTRLLDEVKKEIDRVGLEKWIKKI